MAAWVAAGGAVLGGALAGYGASSAGEDSAKAAEQASAIQYKMWRKGREDLEPWREAGGRGLGEYEDLAGQYGAYADEYAPREFSFGADEFNEYKDPGYEFRLEEGLRALDRRMGARGLRRSGVRPRALMELGQNLGSAEFGAARGRALSDFSISEAAREQEYTRRFTDPLNRSFTLAEAGRGTAGSLATLGATTGRGIASTTLAAGQASAAGTLGQYGAYSSALGDIGNIYSQYRDKTPSSGSLSSYGTATASNPNPYGLSIPGY